MNVIVNYPNANNIKELQKNVAKFKAILIKESVDRLEIDNNSKKIVLEEIAKKFC